MDTTRLVASVIYGAFWAVVFSLVMLEILAFLKQYKNPLGRRAAVRRLGRRMLGAFTIAIILVLLVHPPANELGLRMQILKLLTCLLLCILLMLLILWDFKSIRRELRHEVDDFMNQSARELRSYLEKSRDDSSNSSS
jgi:hypothetical protein